MKMRKRKAFYSCCTAYRYVANGAGVMCVVFDRIEQVEKNDE